jgi:hypothetical protein
MSAEQEGQPEHAMHREFIATPQALERYLRDLAWRRYRVRLSPGLAAVPGPQESLSQAQVRAAVAALQARLSCRATDDADTPCDSD